MFYLLKFQANGASCDYKSCSLNFIEAVVAHFDGPNPEVNIELVPRTKVNGIFNSGIRMMDKILLYTSLLV